MDPCRPESARADGPQQLSGSSRWSQPDLRADLRLGQNNCQVAPVGRNLTYALYAGSTICLHPILQFPVGRLLHVDASNSAVPCNGSCQGARGAP